MIDVSCGSCGKKYKLDPTIIKSENAKFTCTKCGYLTPLDQYASKVSEQSTVETQQEVSREALRVTWSNQLQVRVNTVLMLLIIVIMSVFTLWTYSTERDKMNSDLQSTSANVAKRLSKYLVEAFWSLDDEILEESLRSEMLDRDIYAINLIDRSGKKIYMGYHRNQEWEIIENKQPIQDETLISAIESIKKEENQIGKVEVYFSPRYIVEQFKQSMLRLVGTSVLLLVAVGIVVYIVLSKMILSPIERLTAIANRISVGNLDLEIPIESKDEIGRLAEAFARMKVSMAFAIKQLRKR